MKSILVVLSLLIFVSCSSSDKKEDIEQAKDQVSEQAQETMADLKEPVNSVVDESVNDESNSVACDAKLNRTKIDFGSPKVTSRAFRRLRIKSSGHTITNVSSFSRPFGYYNSGEFPGEATYHNYDLCSMNSLSRDCSLNLEFRPRAVKSYNDSMTISYTDSSGNDCSVEVPLVGVSTESYLGEDSSR